MPIRGREHYFGSYGIVRGYGPLCKSLGDADESVYDDNRIQRRIGGVSDRNVVLVNRSSGLCWWWEEGDALEADLVPVRTPDGRQAVYDHDVIDNCEALWSGPSEMAGFS